MSGGLHGAAVPGTIADFGRFVRLGPGRRQGGPAAQPTTAGRQQNEAVPNVYFELTREFNRDAPVAALASGQAVVYYRVAIMSKDKRCRC